MLYNWFQHIEFAYPAAFLLLLLLPLAVYWYISRDLRGRGAFRLATVKYVGQARSLKTTLRHLPFILRLLTIGCLIVVLARPQTRNEEQLISGEGIDIMLCMDVSGSMLAQDFLPNRLEAMKKVAADFVDRRPTDRIGLVIFAGESFTSSPITMDRNTLKSQILDARTGYLADGTAIGDGLATSIERLKDSKAKSRVVILLTDGDDQGGLLDPLSAKEIAKAMGVKVYTIGMASEGFANTPLQDDEGRSSTRRQKVNIDEQLLRDIAGETGGMYFRAKDNESLRHIYAEIDKLEKSTVQITRLTRFSERFLPFALTAAFLLLAEVLLRYTVFKKFP